MLIGAVRLLPGDRLLAFSSSCMMIYDFNIVKEVEVTGPNITSNITEPLWKLPFADTRTLHGALSQGLSTPAATRFIVKAKALHEITIPHNKHEVPYFRELMALEQLKDMTFAIGFEKSFIQHSDRSVMRLSLTQGIREQDKGDCFAHSDFPVISRDYPTTPNGARLPKLDEETGRLVQDFRDGFLVIDTATLYAKKENSSML